MPSREQLASNLRVSLRSLQGAVDELVADGTLVTLASKGTRVTDHPDCLQRIALLLPPDEHPGLCTSLRAASDAWSGPESFSCLNLHDLPQVVDDLSSYRYRGIILLDEVIGYSTAMQERLQSLPLVVIGYLSEAFPRVHLDLYASISWSLRQLAAEGFQRIAVISHARQSNQLQNRLRQWVKMLNLPYDPRLWLEISINSSHTSANLMPLLWSLPADERPQAILITDDHLVPAVTKALKSCIQQEPLPHIMAHANYPRMSRSALPAQRYGFYAADILKHAIELLHDRDNNRTSLRTIRPQCLTTTAHSKK